jgi:prolyl oligopeptidase
LFTCLSINTWGQEYVPTKTKENPIIDTFFNKYIIEDKYQWLEDVNSVESKNWVDHQNELAENYLSKTINKTRADVLIEEVRQINYNYAAKEGDYYFRFQIDRRGIGILYSQSSFNAPLKVVFDPTDISNTDAITLDEYDLSKDSKLLACRFRRNGSDWNEIIVVSMKDRRQTMDHLKGIKFANVSWLSNGFFYSTFSQDQQFGETNGQRVFYHKIGTSQEDDKLVFERKNNLLATFDYLTTFDERYFILSERNKESGKFNIFYIDYSSDDPHLKPLLLNRNEPVDILDEHEGKFIATTTYKSNNGSIVEIDPLDPLKWCIIVPEFPEEVLLKAKIFKERIVGYYQANQHAIIRVFTHSGELLFEKGFNMVGNVEGFSGNYLDEEFLFRFSSYVIPPVVYTLNIKTFKMELTEKTEVTYDVNTIECKDVIITTKDSVQVPMVLVYKRGLKLNGKNPTLLKAYGGFGVVETPSFDAGIVYFVKRGGVFAFANIRGGGDKGEVWAKAGRGNNKQNSFDDFISAAEYLIQNKYTSPEKLAATGGSHGGLVVAAAAIQRPDLFKVVVPIVAPLDMIRKEKFTIGHLNNDEYGTVKDSLSFTNLLDYSPYHNIKADINYPSMLIVTSENDDRVPPFHSYKFAAALQSRSAQKNPVILMIEKKAGHYGATNYNSYIKEAANIYGFVLNELDRE